MICPKCGKEVSDAIPICELCGARLEDPLAEEEIYEEALEAAPEVEAKPLMGFLGATLGAAACCALIVLLPRLGLPSYLGGIVVAFVIFMGYGMLNKVRTKISVGVCVMFVIFTPYIADRLLWSVWMMENIKELAGITLFEAFLGMPIMLDADQINIIEYFMGLFRLYLFTAIGGVIYLTAVLRARKKRRLQQMLNR